MYAIREPKAAGLFYNADRDSLEREIEMSFKGKDGPKEIESESLVAIITPHDKYHLCGPVCAWSFAKTEKSNYIIIGANHFDIGSRFAVMKEGLWKTPLGEVAVGNRVAQKIIDKSKILDYDVISHDSEHSVEVQLPFLQYRFGSDFKIVPIVIRNRFEDRDFVKQCQELGRSIAHAIMTEKEKWTIIATTDLSRGSKAGVEKVDKILINSLKNLSERKFFDAVHKNSSYICGYGAVITALAAAKEMNAKRSRLLKYMSSMEILKDPKSVVGYASILVQ